MLFCLLSRLLHVPPAVAGTLVVLVAFTARIPRTATIFRPER